jgi:feruloyl-CoA synthase
MKMGMRAVALPWENVTFEPSPDGSLRVRNSAQPGPYPPRLTKRLRHWAADAPDRELFASRDGEGWQKVTYLEALNSVCAIGQAARSRSLRLAARPHLIWQWNRARPVIAQVSACGHTVCSAVDLLLVNFDGQEERI